MNTETFAKLSALAYRQHGETESQWQSALADRLAAMGFERLRAFDRVDTQGFIAMRGGDVVVVFRGTEPQRLADVRADRWFWPTRDRHGRAHEGFAAALDTVWPDMFAELFPIRSLRRVRVHFTGHSMGGALAVIAAARMLTHCRVGGLVTFGAPPCVDRFTARMLSTILNGKCIRVERADVVPMLLRTLYGAPGHLTYITRGGAVVERAGWWVATGDRVAVAWDSIRRRVSAALRGRIRDVFTTPRFLAGHSVVGYALALSANTAQQAGAELCRIDR
ncbi:Lipase (class 3) [Crateriforma conspicua]|uniref:Lipase (Class 3) n=1 Tax=Crateriforma conspicua TaxID=2527996 RepID=A0A5C6G1C1_9PLAN|nr:lipase family protein [Crateriforma conspicua]TWU67290.1 Lipase (class 3) [Crateriforma conspicua]